MWLEALDDGDPRVEAEFRDKVVVAEGPDFDETWELRTVNPPATSNFGAGCAGSAGIPGLRVSGLPWTGSTVDLVLSLYESQRTGKPVSLRSDL